MTDAFIFDHVRTPRGRGKPDGSLHTATTLRLAATALKAIKDRNHLDPHQVDDVVMGCVDPVGEAGSDIARMGALAAGFGDTVPGVQINRFCASGLDSVNFAAAQVMSGQHDLTIGGGVDDASFPAGHGLGIRRTKLHHLMIERAAAAGVHLLWQTVVTGLHADGVWLGTNLVRARWIVGADGAHSRVRQWAGLDDYVHHQQRFAFRRHYRISPWTNCMELHWGSNCQLYVTPVAPDEICVAAISRDPHLRLDAALAKFPAVAARLAGLERTSTERGAVSATRKLRQVYRGRTALIGDASGGVDAITGEGLCLAFRQAILLSECFADGRLDPYQAGHRTLGRRPALMSWLMLTLESRDSFRQRVMQAFATQPRTFARMLALHVGAATPLTLAGIGLSLGWNLLTP